LVAFFQYNVVVNAEGQKPVRRRCRYTYAAQTSGSFSVVTLPPRQPRDRPLLLPFMQADGSDHDVFALRVQSKSEGIDKA
jgi:hypothetical protein